MLTKGAVERKLNAALQEAGINAVLESSEPDGDLLVYRLSNTKESIPIKDGDENSLAYVIFSDHKSELQYCITLKVIFDVEEGELDSIAVRLHSGTRTEFYGYNPRQPIIRAELARNGNTRMRYGQPHWHAGVVSSEPKQFNPTEESTQTPLEKFIEWFHFAMCAQWHLVPPQECTHRMEVDSVAAWLKSCICYIREHIEAIESKAGLMQPE